MPRKNNRNAQRPKRAMNPYCIFVKEMKGKKETQNLTFLQFTKFCADKWKQLTTNQKQCFRDKALADKKRYNYEVKYFGPTKPKKDKRPMSAFLHFCQVYRPKIKAQHPEWKITELVKELAKLWNTASVSQKMRYKIMAQKKMKRYYKLKEIKEEKEYRMKRNKKAQNKASDSESD